MDFPEAPEATKKGPEQTHPTRHNDVIGGVTTFFTMAYIIVVNPQILSTNGTGMPFDGVLAATILTAASMTLLMGLYAKIPFAVAPGMGMFAIAAISAGILLLQTFT